MYTLPVSAEVVVPRTPDGHDEMRLAEGREEGPRERLEAVRRLAPPRRPGVSWESLPYPDVDAALLAVRRWRRGAAGIADVAGATGGARGYVSISFGKYLAATRPRSVRGVNPAADGGWEGEGVRLRCPTAGEVIEALDEGTEAAEALERRCIAGAATSALARRANMWLERLAPPLAGAVTGRCPECGEAIRGWFDPGAFVLAELRREAAGVLEQVHLLASCYRWGEGEILALPASRRAYYAEAIAAERREQ